MNLLVLQDSIQMSLVQFMLVRVCCELDRNKHKKEMKELNGVIVSYFLLLWSYLVTST